MMCPPFFHIKLKYLLLLIGYPSQVDGKSMNPTLKDSDWVFTNRWSVWRTQIYRGDIVIFISHRGKNLGRYFFNRGSDPCVSKF